MRTSIKINGVTVAARRSINFQYENCNVEVEDDPINDCVNVKIEIPPAIDLIKRLLTDLIDEGFDIQDEELLKLL